VLVAGTTPTRIFSMRLLARLKQGYEPDGATTFADLGDIAFGKHGGKGVRLVYVMHQPPILELALNPSTVLNGGRFLQSLRN
jgi:hypothetical protein